MPLQPAELSREVVLAHKISEGAFAEVFCGDHNGKPVAIKIPKPDKKGASRAAEREIRVMQRLNHENICSLFGTFQDNNSCSLSLVTELLDGDLRRLMAEPDLLPGYAERLSWMLQLARGIAYMHEQNFVHQDIKLENVLFRTMADGSKVIKLCDFGLTRRMLGHSFSNPTRIGTALYMSPEVLEASEYLTQKIDIYCFAFAVWELLAGQKAFTDQTKFVQLRKTVLSGIRPVIPAWCSNRVRDLISYCWASNPEDRPSMAYVVLELESILKDNDVLAPAFGHLLATSSVPSSCSSSSSSSSAGGINNKETPTTLCTAVQENTALSYAGMPTELA